MKIIIKYGSIILTAIALTGCSKSNDTTTVGTDISVKTESTTQVTTKAVAEKIEEPTSTIAQTENPTEKPAEVPTEVPTEKPTEAPTEAPTQTYVEPPTQYVPPVVEETTQYVPPTEAPTQAQPTYSGTHKNFFGIDYLIEPNRSSRILTSEAEILQAMVDGFNYARHQSGTTEEIRNSTLTLDYPLSADCKARATELKNMNSFAHLGLAYADKHTLENVYTRVSEGVTPMHIDATRIYDGTQHACTEYENYVSYERAFAAGKDLCYHIWGQDEDIWKLGIGIEFGRWDDITSSVDYWCVLTIICKK